MVVFSKVVLTAAVIAPALALPLHTFDPAGIRYGHAVHLQHEKVEGAETEIPPHESLATVTEHEARKVPTDFEEGIVKHHLHSHPEEPNGQIALEPRDATAEETTAGAADTTPESPESPTADPANEPIHDVIAHGHRHEGQEGQEGLVAHELAHTVQSGAAHKAGIAEKAETAEATSSAPPAAAPTGTGAGPTPPANNPPKSEPDFLSKLLNLVFKSPNNVDTALTKEFNQVGTLFGADGKPAHQHTRRFDMEEEELFERDFSDDLELEARSFEDDFENYE